MLDRFSVLVYFTVVKNTGVFPSVALYKFRLRQTHGVTYEFELIISTDARLSIVENILHRDIFGLGKFGTQDQNIA